MNRKQRRTIEKVARRRGATKKEAKTYTGILNNADAIRNGGVGETTPPKEFNEGDKVTLNIERVKSRKNYDRMADAYKEFVSESEGAVFTVHIERENMISFVENPRWLFWSGDLDKVTDEN